jgi:hypothetical protein
VRKLHKTRVAISCEASHPFYSCQSQPTHQTSSFEQGFLWRRRKPRLWKDQTPRLGQICHPGRHQQPQEQPFRQAGQEGVGCAHQRAGGEEQGGRLSFVRGDRIIEFSLTYLYFQSNLNEKFRNYLSLVFLFV